MATSLHKAQNNTASTTEASQTTEAPQFRDTIPEDFLPEDLQLTSETQAFRDTILDEVERQGLPTADLPTNKIITATDGQTPHPANDNPTAMTTVADQSIPTIVQQNLRWYSERPVSMFIINEQAEQAAQFRMDLYFYISAVYTTPALTYLTDKTPQYQEIIAPALKTDLLTYLQTLLAPHFHDFLYPVLVELMIKLFNSDDWQTKEGIMQMEQILQNILIGAQHQIITP